MSTFDVSTLLHSPLGSAVTFVAGIGLVVWSVGAFVRRVGATAAGLGISPFLLTIILAGTDLENAVLGGAAQLGDLPGVALGTVFGEAAFILCAGVGLGGLAVPFTLTLPTRHLILAAAAPLPLLVLSIDRTLSRLEGVLLVLLFPTILWLLYRWERRAAGPLLTARDDISEHPRDQRPAVLQVGALIFLVSGTAAGSALAVHGTKGILTLTGIGGLAFGATVVSLIASLEEVLLTVVPLRLGKPTVAAGNVLGSLVFFVTANAGVLAVLRPLALEPAVFGAQFPFLILALTVVLLLFRAGTVGRPAGVGLVLLYSMYWLLNLS